MFMGSRTRSPIEEKEMSKHRVTRLFQAGAPQMKIGDVIDTTNAPPRNIQSLVEGRFLERVPEDTPLTEIAPASTAKSQGSGSKGSGGK
jgi:hypothetical protein